jgi:hypothetical protein
VIPYEREAVMAVVARIIGYSLLTALTAGLGAAWFGYALFGHDSGFALPAFLLACVGAIVGVVAGAAGEIVTAQRRYAEPGHRKQMSKTYEGLD